MRLLGNFTIREHGGKKYAMPYGDAAKSFSGMLELNSIGAFIFNFLTKPTSEEEIADAITARYSADRTRVNADVRTFISKLRTANLIVE